MCATSDGTIHWLPEPICGPVEAPEAEQGGILSLHSPSPDAFGPMGLLVLSVHSVRSTLLVHQGSDYTRVLGMDPLAVYDYMHRKKAEPHGVTMRKQQRLRNASKSIVTASTLCARNVCRERLISCIPDRNMSIQCTCAAPRFRLPDVVDCFQSPTTRDKHEHRTGFEDKTIS
jgi:hypothetical protein